MTIRVLYYESGSGFGGSAVSAYRLVKYLKGKGIELIVLVCGIGPGTRDIENLGVEVRVLRKHFQFGARSSKPRGFWQRGFGARPFYGNTILNAPVILQLPRDLIGTLRKQAV